MVCEAPCVLGMVCRSLSGHAMPSPHFREPCPRCLVTGHTSPVEALTAFGYVKMEFSGLRFQAFYYESITRLYYIYGIFSKMFYPKSSFFTSIHCPPHTPSLTMNGFSVPCPVQPLVRILEIRGDSLAGSVRGENVRGG